MVKITKQFALELNFHRLFGVKRLCFANSVLGTSDASDRLWILRTQGLFVLHQLIPSCINIYSYGHLPVISGYKWDYTFYKWGYKYL